MSASPTNLPPDRDSAGTPIPAQRDPDELCQFCEKHPRWKDTAHGHYDGWRLCTHCIRAYLEANRRLADALARTEPA